MAVAETIAKLKETGGSGRKKLAVAAAAEVSIHKHTHTYVLQYRIERLVNNNGRDTREREEGGGRGGTNPSSLHSLFVARHRRRK